MNFERVKQSGGCGLLILFIGLILYGIYTLIVNATNILPTTWHLSFRQASSNVLHLHTDKLMRLKIPMRAYEKIVKANELEGGKYIELLPGTVVKYKGYMARERITWVSFMGYLEQNEFYGYFMIPNTSDDFIELFEPVDVLEPYLAVIDEDVLKDSLYQNFEREVKKEIKLEAVKGALEIQKRLDEGKGHQISLLKSPKNVAYFTDGENVVKLVKIYDKYLGKQYQQNILRLIRKPQN